MAGIRGITLEPGYIIIEGDSGPPRKFPIADVIRSADVPDVPISALTLLVRMTGLFVDLVKTLIEKGVLDDEWQDEKDLGYIIAILEDYLNIEW